MDLTSKKTQLFWLEESRKKSSRAVNCFALRSTVYGFKFISLAIFQCFFISPFFNNGEITGSRHRGLL